MFESCLLIILAAGGGGVSLVTITRDALDMTIKGLCLCQSPEPC